MTERARFAFRNFHDEATLTASSELDDSFAVANTQNDSRDKAWRSTTTLSATISGTFTRPRTINFVAMTRHRNHGAQIAFQGYDDNAWSTPTTGGAVAAEAFNKIVGSSSDVAFAQGDDTYGIGQYDPLIALSPWWHYFANAITIQSYRFTFSSHSTTFWDDAFWHVSRIYLGKYWTPTRGPNPESFELSFDDNTDTNRTRAASLRTSVGEMWRRYRFTLNGVTEQDAATWMQNTQTVGRAKTIFMSLFPEDGTLRERDNMGIFKLTGLSALGRRDVLRLTNAMQLEEI